MFFITIFTICAVSQFAAIPNQKKDTFDDKIEILTPIVFEDRLIPKNQIVYNKVPTNLIKIDKNSN